MSIKKSYAVFGLGKYGMAVAKELVESGADVLAVDKDQIVVNEAALEIPVCKCADVTDAEVIKRLGISEFDVVVISMADSFEASIMATVLCKEAGVNNVIVKCGSEMHTKILEKVGADKLIFPEKESGVRLAQNLLSSGFVDMVDLSDDVSIVEVDVKKEWLGKNLIELNLRQKYGINVVALCKGESVIVNVDPKMPFDEEMKLIVIAETVKLAKLNK